MKNTRITVLCSTYNRAHKIRSMLDALIKQTLDETQWKLVIVDNNSSDNTQEVLKEYEDKLPLTILFEPRQGKSVAMNTAFDYIEGEFITTIDDDIIPYETWLENLVGAIEKNANYDIFCGYIEPYWECEPETWMKHWPHQGIVFAVNPELKEGEMPYFWVTGGNAAYRVSALGGIQYGHEMFGPSAGDKAFLMGDDVYFASQLAERGSKAYFISDAKVRHSIPPERMREEYILNRVEDYGRSRPYIRSDWFEGKVHFFGCPLTTLIKYSALRMLSGVVKSAPVSKFRYDLLAQYRMSKGIIETCRSISKGEGQPL